MKIADANAKIDHVRVSRTIGESQDFRNYLALSRDSYPMGLGRLVALGLQVLILGRHHFSRFELDRIVQWPADRKLLFADVLESVGWARPRTNSGTLVELTLPSDLVPRKPHKERAKFRAVRLRNDDGQFASREEVEAEILMWKNREVVLIDMDGNRRTEIDSVSQPKKKSTMRRKANSDGNSCITR